MNQVGKQALRFIKCRLRNSQIKVDKTLIKQMIILLPYIVQCNMQSKHDIMSSDQTPIQIKPKLENFFENSRLTPLEVLSRLTIVYLKLRENILVLSKKIFFQFGGRTLVLLQRGLLVSIFFAIFIYNCFDLF